MKADSARIEAIYTDLMSHIVAELGPHLPEGKTLVASHSQLVLASTEGGKSRTVSTCSVSTPATFDIDAAWLFSRRLLADAQDLVSLHLHEPWPRTASGFVAHPFVEPAAATLRLGYRAPEHDDETIRLADYLIEEDRDPPSVRPAG